MTHFRNISKSNAITFVIVLLLLTIQVMPCGDDDRHLTNRLPGLTNNETPFILSSYSNSLSLNSVRQFQVINTSPGNNVFDKYDIVPIPDLTNHKIIYGGSFSYKQRYSTFLTVMFSTGS